MNDKLQLMRAPFPANQISYLPKGGVKLAYVGHAALTDRLLDCDPAWQWEPLSLDPDGLPALDTSGGLWIRLTVCGVTRLGYGDAGTKKGGDAMKERIGDALRNAAMRFGAALDLWHKGDLHAEPEYVLGSPDPNTGDVSWHKAEPEPKPDMSPKARAERMHVGVVAGDAKGVAQTLADMPPAESEAIMALLPDDIFNRVTAAWPKVTA